MLPFAVAVTGPIEPRGQRRRAHSLFAGLNKLSVFARSCLHSFASPPSYVYLTYRAMSDKRVEYKAGFGTKPRSWHRCIEVARMKLDKRLKCDADSDASTSVLLLL